MLFQNYKIVVCILLAIALNGCSKEASLGSKLRNYDPYNYLVQQGDTLYSIAWRYDLDYRDIARWNNIRAPYLIKPAQMLRLRGPAEVKPKNYLFAPVSDEQEAAQSLAENTPDYSNPDNIPPAPPVPSARTGAPDVKKKSAIKKVPVYRKPVKKTDAYKPAKPRASVPTYSKAKTRWSWPVKGKVISTFSAKNNSRKGIDIAANPGEKVRAAADGVVVYSGAGLVSYGNLVIVKHNDRYLSAYAYNKKLLVKEGARVKQGQSIAIIGKRLKVTNLLHFEIRKDGKPVNPLIYLPKI